MVSSALQYPYVGLRRSHAHSNACGCLTTIRRLLSEGMHQFLQAPQIQTQLVEEPVANTYLSVLQHACLLHASFDLNTDTLPSQYPDTWKCHVRDIM